MRWDWKAAAGAAMVVVFATSVSVVALADDDRYTTTRILPDGGAGSFGPGPVRALARWADFPVTADPRPMIVFEPYDFDYDPDGSDEEVGFSHGLWTLPPTLPDAPAQRDGLRLLSAEAAAAKLQRVLGDASRRYVDAGAAAGRPIAMTSARLIHRQFATDRGSRLLPTWEFHFGAAHTEPTFVLAVAEPLYDPPFEAAAKGVAVVSPDGRTLTYRFSGEEEGHHDCQSEFFPLIQESPTAVAIGVEEHRHHSNDSPCDGVGRAIGHAITFSLAAPLGNRVVVSHQRGLPMAVLDSEEDAARQRRIASFAGCLGEIRDFKICLRRQPDISGLTLEDLRAAPVS